MDNPGANVDFIVSDYDRQVGASLLLGQGHGISV
jgi:hypothetical protein